jgi:hypothetical protein
VNAEAACFSSKISYQSLQFGNDNPRPAGLTAPKALGFLKWRCRSPCGPGCGYLLRDSRHSAKNFSCQSLQFCNDPAAYEKDGFFSRTWVLVIHPSDRIALLDIFYR